MLKGLKVTGYNFWNLEKLPNLFMHFQLLGQVSGALAEVRNWRYSPRLLLFLRMLKTKINLNEYVQSNRAFSETQRLFARAGLGKTGINWNDES